MRNIQDFVRNILTIPNRSRKIRQIQAIAGGFLLTVFIILFLTLSEQHDDNLRLQITFILLAYIFIILPFSIRKLRTKLLTLIGYNGYIFERWHMIYYGVIAFSLIPFTFYSLASTPNNPLRPDTSFNPYYLVPDSFRFYLIVISATLGGLVLAASNNRRLKNVNKRALTNVAKKFIVSTISLIFFAVCFYNANIYGFIEPTKWQIPITPQSVYIAVNYWVSLFCFYIGIILFLLGMFELVISLSHISGSRH